MSSLNTLLLGLFTFIFVNISFAGAPPASKYQAKTFVIDQHGGADFITIQSAINATANVKDVILLIKPGTYKEKLYITRNNLSLVGSSVNNTFIEYAELRSNWREKNTNDWGAAVINIDATNINIVNLSVTNNYGRLYNNNDHQFAIRGFNNTNRVILHQCAAIADGADTVSLWNKESGMYYHSYCHFEGYLDMVCPRGWALIENSTFFNKQQHATLWHDGELNQDQKLVVTNSKFDGVKGFWLGRHHYDAQFYVMDSTFSENMADKAIFKKQYNDKNKIRANNYGSRYFFNNNTSSHKFKWLETNFDPNKTHLKNQTTEQWVFNNQWQPNNALKGLQQRIAKTDFVFDAFSIN